MRRLHTSGFDNDEDGLQTRVTNMSWLEINFLSGRYT
jgi:hypothetical protein